MDDFVYVLIGGLMLFTIAFAIMGQGPSSEFGSGSQAAEMAGAGVREILASKDVINLGTESKQSVRTMDLGSFSVGYSLEEETIESQDKIEVKRSVLVNQEGALSFSGEKARKAYVSFTVAQTNRYGALIIEVNGKPLETKISELGNYRLELVNVNAGENTVKFSCESSGAKFWAPTTYVLTDIELIIETEAKKEKQIPFNVYGYEFDDWDKAKVSFEVKQSVRNAPLSIEVNGRQVYSEMPSSSAKKYEKEFSKLEASIKKGENTIVFKTAEGGDYQIQNAGLQIFFYAAGEVSSDYSDFRLSGGQFLKVQEGTEVLEVFFRADEILNSELMVFVNDKKQPFQIKQGDNIIVVDKDDLKSGTNKLKVSTYGRYTVRDLQVRMSKPVVQETKEE